MDDKYLVVEKSWEGVRLGCAVIHKNIVERAVGIGISLTYSSLMR